MKLTKGWASLGNGVYENHALCVRVSMLGGMLLPDQEYLSGTEGSNNALRYIKIQGGNRKRGLLLWAESEAEKYRKARLEIGN